MSYKHPPKFCPNCGAKLEGDNAIQEYWLEEEPLKGIGYDTYCQSCKWSGNIEPDSDSEITEREVVS